MRLADGSSQYICAHSCEMWVGCGIRIESFLDWEMRVATIHQSTGSFLSQVTGDGSDPTR